MCIKRRKNKSDKNKKGKKTNNKMPNTNQQSISSLKSTTDKCKNSKKDIVDSDINLFSSAQNCILDDSTDKETIFKEIDVLNSQIISCQEESTSYNNSYISSAIICAIITAVGGFMQDSSTNISVMIILFIPIVYLHMVFNLLKYTGFQVQLGTYRHELEEKVNILLKKTDYLCLMEKKTEHRKFFKYSGIGVGFFVFPPMILLGFMVYSIQGYEIIKYIFYCFYIIEFFICVTLAFEVVVMIRLDEPNYKETRKRSLWQKIKICFGIIKNFEE